MGSPRHATTTVASTEGLTVIGEGIHVNGQIHGEEDLRIEGRVEGSISLTETVHVAASGVVVATIQARDVVVSGVVVGNVSASNSVSLDPGAKLVGDISAPRLIIADGAAFRGNVAMGDAAGTIAPRARPAAATTGRSRAATTARRAQRSETRATPAPRPTERSVPRVAAIRPPGPAPQHDDEVTVIVRHAALSEQEQEAEPAEATRTTTKKKAKKAPPRGRVPKRGKRQVNRR